MEDAKTKFLKEIKAIKSYDLEKLGEAYDVAYKQHNGQKRKSGEPYIIHPEAVAKILAELGMDEDTLIAGLLHDVIEDTDFTPEMVEEKFGSDVRHLDFRGAGRRGFGPFGGFPAHGLFRRRDKHHRREIGRASCRERV